MFHPRFENINFLLSKYNKIKSLAFIIVKYDDNLLFKPCKCFVFKSLINKIYKSDFVSEAADSKLR